tara:strand:- start:74 stop:388 length:315 start_codon:yes stop_codon:yes gene_type:complete
MISIAIKLFITLKTYRHIETLTENGLVPIAQQKKKWQHGLSMNNKNMLGNEMPLGFIGFTHIQHRFFAEALFVRGKRVIHIPVPYPIYKLWQFIWRTKRRHETK